MKKNHATNRYVFTNPVRIAICLAILLVLLADPQPASACSCIMPGPPYSEFARNDAVFTGQVTRIVDVRNNLVIPFLEQALEWLGYGPTYSSTFYGNRVTFSVHNSWKGVTTSTVQVHTNYGGGDCGYQFDIGSDYLIYGYGPADGLETSVCSRTAEVSHAAQDLSHLNTLPTLPLTTPQTQWLWIIPIAFIVLAAVLAGIGFVRLHRQERLKANANE